MKLLKAILIITLLLTPLHFSHAQTQETIPYDELKLFETLSEKEKAETCKYYLDENYSNPPSTCLDTLPILPKPDLLPGPTNPQGENNPEETLNYVTQKLIPQAATRFVTIIAVLSMIGIIFAGFKYYTAFGDDSKAEEGKKIVQYSVIGLVVSLMSLAIVNIIAALAQFFQ